MEEKRPGLFRRLASAFSSNPPKTTITEEVKQLGGTPLAINNLITNSTTVLTGIGNVEDEQKLLDFYKEMDADAVISSGLDIYADNATQASPKTGHVASIESADKNFTEEINEFLWNVVKVDTEMWEWTRRLVRDGKLILDTRAVKKGAEWSFVPITKPANVVALVEGQHDIKYYLVKNNEDKPQSSASSYYSLASNDKKEESTIVPKDNYISAFYKADIVGTVEIESTSAISGNSNKETLNIKSGRSLLYSVKNDWQILCALEDAIFQSRLAKSRNFRLVTVDVSDSNNEQAKQIVDAVKNAFKSSETIDMQSSRYNSRQSPIPMDDFVYVPKKGEKGSVTVQPIMASESSAIPMQDVEYFRNKVFAGLAVLKAYLGNEETTPGGLGDSTLTMLDERLGRRIKRVQTLLKQLLKDIVEYYWVYSDTNRTIESMPKYSIILGKVSTKEEKEAADRLNGSIDTARNILDLATAPEFEGLYSTEKLFKYVFNTIIGINVDLIDTSADKAAVNITLHKKQESLTEKTQVINPTLDKIKPRGKRVNFIDTKLESLMPNILGNELIALFNDHDIFLESTAGKKIRLEDAIRRPQFKKLLNEKSYKELKAKTKQTDPKRVEKSKKITVRYTGLDKDNYVTFRVTAEDPKANAEKGRPTSYETKVALKDLLYLVKENIKETNPLNDKDLVQLAMQGDVAVGCTCPASMYWGQQYNGTKQDYSIVKNTIEPTRNKQYQTLCKHVVSTVTVLPFWWNTIVKDLRKKGLLSAKKPAEQPVEQKVEETPDQELKDLKDAENKLS